MRHRPIRARRRVGAQRGCYDDRVENKALVLDFLEWLSRGPRPYSEVMEAWRTSCPRLQIWEDAVDHGLVESARGNGSGEIVSVTAAGREFLATHDRLSATAQ